MGCLAIPGTDILTDVTAKEVMTDTLACLLRNFSAQFDCGVSDALPTVENVRLNDGMGRAGINAARTGSASIGGGNARVQFEVGENAPEKQPGTGLLVDDACVFTVPPDTGIFREDSLQNRPCIDISLCF